MKAGKLQKKFQKKKEIYTCSNCSVGVNNSAITKSSGRMARATSIKYRATCKGVLKYEENIN